MQAKQPASSFLAVTAHVSSDEVERARAVGSSAHIGKSFDNTALLQNIARLLRSN